MEQQGTFFETEELEKMYGLDLEHWRAAGHELRREIRRVGKNADQWKWKLGDWLLAGEKSWGERKIKLEAPKIWKKPWGTLKNFRWVSRVFPRESSRRRDGVSWEHHRVVAALPEHEQNKKLDHCKKWHTPIHQFRATIKGEKLVKEEYADREATMKGEFPLLIEPIKVSYNSNVMKDEYFTDDASALLLYLFETERPTHGQEKRVQFLAWLMQKGMESLRWEPKVKEFLANRKAQRKARHAEIVKRDGEVEARRVAQEADFKAKKAAWEKSRNGTSNQT